MRGPALAEPPDLEVSRLPDCPPLDDPLRPKVRTERPPVGLAVALLPPDLRPKLRTERPPVGRAVALLPPDLRPERETILGLERDDFECAARARPECPRERDFGGPAKACPATRTTASTHTPTPIRGNMYRRAFMASSPGVGHSAARSAGWRHPRQPL